MQLLLIPTSWPYGGVVEFLDDEIQHLSRAFDRVVVAPMRPKGELMPGLPESVVIDHSLAQHLEQTNFGHERPSRARTAAVRLFRRNSAGLGCTRRELLQDGTDPTWLRTSLLNRADSTSVAQWAARRTPPNLAYTFWLGAASVGLRHAWPGVSVISRVHGGDLFSEAHHWGSIPFQAAAIRSNDLIASVSDVGRDYLARKFPEAASKMVVRRLGIRDLGPRVVIPKDGPLRILSASSIDSNKRVDLIAQVAQYLAATGHTVEWTHLGDGGMRPAIDTLLSEGPTGLKVHLAGQVPPSMVHQELTAGGHHVFVNLSLSEGAPVSLMEAQCVGLPVVATSVGGTPEVVPAAFNELVSTSATIAEVGAAVLRAAGRPTVESQMRRDHWFLRYRADANYSLWANELADLAREPR